MPEISGTKQKRITGKRKLRRFVYTFIALLIIFFFAPLPFITENQEIAIYDQAFRSVFDSEDFENLQKHSDIFYTGISTSSFGVPLFTCEGGFTPEIIDPSDKLLEKMRQWPQNIQPDSNYIPPDPNDPEVKDRKTILVYNDKGEIGSFLYVGPIRKTVGLAHCRTGHYTDAMAAAEYHAFFIWTPFGWKHLLSSIIWMA